jgi:flagellar protein FlaG
MNEVTNTQMVSRPATGAASSQGVTAAQMQATTLQQAGKPLPAAAEKGMDDPARIAASEQSNIDTAVASMNDFVQSVQRDLRFSVDEDLNRTVVKVIDSDSGELIRQIPEEVFLELARKLKDEGEFQLVQALG